MLPPSARILCVVSGLPSVLYPSLELARRLAAAGHRVTFASHAGARPLVEHHGLDFLDLEPSRHEAFLAADTHSLPRRLLRLRERRAQAREAMSVGGFARALRERAPDLVLVNGEMHEHVIAALGAGARVALLNTFVSIWRQPGLPPPHALVLPGVGWKGSRAGIRLLWLALDLRKTARALVLRARAAGCDRVSILRLLAREAGLDLRRETDDRQWLIPFTWSRLPVLSLHALELELPHRPPERVRYVGPMLLASRPERPMGDEDRARLGAVLERRRLAGDERKLVYAAFGSTFTAEPSLLLRLAEAVAREPDWELVVSLSDRVSPAEISPLPERVHAFPWLPQLEVLRDADVAVNHGGIGTIDECVTRGVPSLVYCGFETDMGGTTARVVHHGIGIAGDRRRDGPDAIRAHLRRLLEEPGFVASVHRLRASYAAYAERRVAERAVESLLGAS
jgi:UDP:flavonoid glycosyltransferase YjiC (YdhE family)